MQRCRSICRARRSQGRSCICSRRYFQDEAFRWATKNKDKARAALTVPPTKVYTQPLTTLEDYLEQRGWETSRDPAHGLALVSHVLSAPLTLRYHAEQAVAADSNLPDVDVCCIGARAEATLPTEYWKEILMAPSQWRLYIGFVGPDLMSNTPPVRLHHHGSEINMHVHWDGLFHDVPSKLNKQWDHFLLLNPGLGHPNLKSSWLPTIKKLRGQSVWLTAHSEADAERDARILLDEMGLSVNYRLNPFASRIVFQDPFDKTHFVSPNKFIASITKCS